MEGERGRGGWERRVGEEEKGGRKEEEEEEGESRRGRGGTVQEGKIS